MMSHFLIVGLGNPGEEYENTPHNAGRIVVEAFRLAKRFPDWQPSSGGAVLISKGKLGKRSVCLVLPEEMMNNSGKSLTPLIKSKKQLHELVVVHDDLDLPLGTFKLSFNRGAAGHRGVESIMKRLRSQEFIRLRAGICPVTPTGKLKKPAGTRLVIEYLLQPWSKEKLPVIRKVTKRAVDVLGAIILKPFLARRRRESTAASWVQTD